MNDNKRPGRLSPQEWSPRFIATPTALSIIYEPDNQPQLAPFWRRLELLAHHGYPDEYFRLQRFCGYQFEFDIQILCAWPQPGTTAVTFFVTGPGDGLYQSFLKRYEQGLKDLCREIPPTPQRPMP